MSSEIFVEISNSVYTIIFTFIIHFPSCSSFYAAKCQSNEKTQFLIYIIFKTILGFVFIEKDKNVRSKMNLIVIKIFHTIEKTRIIFPVIKALCSKKLHYFLLFSTISLILINFMLFLFFRN